MERALEEKGQLVYGTGFRNAFPLTTYKGKTKERVRRYEFDDSQLGTVTVVSKVHKESSLKVRGIRSSKPISFVPTIKIVNYYSVTLGEELIRDKERAREVIQSLTGTPLPKDSRIVTDRTLFEETESS